MMVQSMNPPYSFQSKTAEIMSRYRPIAPKPSLPLPNNNNPPARPESTSLVTCQETTQHQQQFLHLLWPRLHDRRTTRTRKRSRGGGGGGGGGALLSLSLAPPTFKRTSSARPAPLLPISFHNNTFAYHHLPPRGLQLNSIAGFEMPPARVTPTRTPTLALGSEENNKLRIDLNATAVDETTTTTTTDLEEKDLLRQLQDDGPHIPTTIVNNVIAPQPVRPVGSTISILDCVTMEEDEDGPSSEGSEIKVTKKEAEEVVERERLPAVITDSNNKVRLANSAYREMVGQPECSWLGLGNNNGKRKRIGGEVMLRVGEESKEVVEGHMPKKGFCCQVKIEWAGRSDIKNKKCISALCEAKRLSCESKDYVFAWRFHTTHTNPKHQPSPSTV